MSNRPNIRHIPQSNALSIKIDRAFPEAAIMGAIKFVPRRGRCWSDGKYVYLTINFKGVAAAQRIQVWVDADRAIVNYLEGAHKVLAKQNAKVA